MHCQNAVCWANHATLASHSSASADDDPACQPFLAHGFAPSSTPSKISEMAPRKGAVGGGVLLMCAACVCCISGVCVLHQRRVCVESAASGRPPAPPMQAAEYGVCFE